jgi:hypothetical protein
VGNCEGSVAWRTCLFLGALSLSLDVSVRWSWWFWGVRTSSEVRSGFVGGSLFCSLFGSSSVRNSGYIGVLFYMIITVLWSRGSLSSWWFFSAWYDDLLCLNSATYIPPGNSVSCAKPLRIGWCSGHCALLLSPHSWFAKNKVTLQRPWLPPANM